MLNMLCAIQVQHRNRCSASAESRTVCSLHCAEEKVKALNAIVDHVMPGRADDLAVSVTMLAVHIRQMMILLVIQFCMAAERLQPARKAGLMPSAQVTG